MKQNKVYIVKVYQTTVNPQKRITIPKDSDLVAGDYVRVEKIQLRGKKK
jgi:hypothetical protein